MRDSSSNGTFVNGERMQAKSELRVVEGDVVSLPCHDESTDLYTFDVTIASTTSTATSVPRSRSNFEKSIRRKAAPAHMPSGSKGVPLITEESSIDNATWETLEMLQRGLFIEAARLSASVQDKAGGSATNALACDMLEAMRNAVVHLKCEHPDVEKALEVLNLASWESKMYPLS